MSSKREKKINKRFATSIWGECTMLFIRQKSNLIKQVSLQSYNVHMRLLLCIASPKWGVVSEIKYNSAAPVY
jgi:hypothetical protein